MWENCFESIEQYQKTWNKGGGCILAHCMGLGKTFQVTFLHVFPVIGFELLSPLFSFLFVPPDSSIRSHRPGKRSVEGYQDSANHLSSEHRPQLAQRIPVLASRRGEEHQFIQVF